jgi:hypothetical protein
MKHQCSETARGIECQFAVGACPNIDSIDRKHAIRSDEVAAQVGAGGELEVDVDAANLRKAVVAKHIDYAAARYWWAGLARGDRYWGGECADREGSSSEEDKA